jgi:hypothetical protein
MEFVVWIEMGRYDKRYRISTVAVLRTTLKSKGKLLQLEQF